MDIPTARNLATKAASAAGTAGRVLLRQGRTDDVQQQTVTISRPVENVLVACRDADVLSTLLGSHGSVRLEAAGRYVWDVAGTTVTTRLHAEPNRVVFSRTGDGEDGEGEGDGEDVLVVEAWPAPRWGGAEVVLRLAGPALPVPAGLVGGGLAFTLLYRLRALLQTGEVPTLGDVPSARRDGASDHDEQGGHR